MTNSQTLIMKHLTTIFGIVAILSLGTTRVLAQSEGLIAHYPLNGDGTDASGNGHDGLVVNAVPAENRFGQDRGALLFDGINSYVDVDDSVDLRLASTDFTITAWFFETERDANYNDCIISKRGPSKHTNSTGSGWIMAVRGLRNPDQTGRLFYQVSGGQDPYWFSSSAMALNQWHHVAVVYRHDTGLLSMFIDGGWDSQTNNMPPPNPDTKMHMHIGNDSQMAYNNAYVFHGRISDVRLYDRALSGGEITDLYGNGFFLKNTQYTGKALTRMYGGLTPNQRVVIESSKDLQHWTPIQTNIVDTANLCVTNYVNPQVGSEFFRVTVH